MFYYVSKNFLSNTEFNMKKKKQEKTIEIPIDFMQEKTLHIAHVAYDPNICQYCTPTDCQTIWILFFFSLVFTTHSTPNNSLCDHTRYHKK